MHPKWNKASEKMGMKNIFYLVLSFTLFMNKRKEKVKNINEKQKKLMSWDVELNEMVDYQAFKAQAIKYLQTHNHQRVRTSKELENKK